MLNSHQLCLFGCIQTSQTGGQPYSEWYFYLYCNWVIFDRIGQNDWVLSNESEQCVLLLFLRSIKRSLRIHKNILTLKRIIKSKSKIWNRTNEILDQLLKNFLNQKGCKMSPSERATEDHKVRALSWKPIWSEQTRYFYFTERFWVKYWAYWGLIPQNHRHLREIYHS